MIRNLISGILILTILPSQATQLMLTLLKWTAFLSVLIVSSFMPQDQLTRLLLCGIWEIWNLSCIPLNHIRMKYSRFSGHLTMRLFWLPVVLIIHWMSGIKVKLERNNPQKMQKMGHQSCCLFMVVTLPRYLISPGIPTNLGWFVLYQKTISCKCGKWLRTFIMMKTLKEAWIQKDKDLRSCLHLWFLDSPFLPLNSEIDLTLVLRQRLCLVIPL